MKNSRLAIINKLESNAKTICQVFNETGLISEELMKAIREIYVSAKAESELNSDRFKVSYHMAITGDLEFLIGRIIHHYLIHKSGVKVFVRCQVEKCAPDIRITKNGKNVAIIEIKATAGWIRPFLSKERYNNDFEKFKSGKSDFDPEKFIINQKKQLTKYKDTFKLKEKNIFFFIPTLAAAHNKKYTSKLNDYYKFFRKVSGLPKKNLILLSSDLTLGLNNTVVDFQNLSPREDFEKMLKSIKTLCG